MRLLIQLASWCCGPECREAGKPHEGSKYPIIDQFSLSVRAGPGQRSGGDNPGGWSSCLQAQKVLHLSRTSGVEP